MSKNSFSFPLVYISATLFTFSCLFAFCLRSGLAEGNNAVVLTHRFARESQCAVCSRLSSFLFSLHRHEISSYCLSVLVKCKLSKECFGVCWLSFPLTPPSAIWFGLIGHLCPTLSVLSGFKGALWFCPSPIPPPSTLSCSISQFHTHSLLFYPYACQSSHSDGCDEM